ncbi:prepilin peptidase CpaA [Paraburkholderia sp. WC7.3g]|uniref:Peptidase A24 n=1 Tax=Paraburkholderia podalyriae TaxID=1938811 RepID=A0ABR7PKY8_9BURK|nr:prepilin peptidase [Paraburkholderia podalyriae]MBC8746966.1 peptidase A24 [Paraburkholderia podalyriae]
MIAPGVVKAGACVTLIMLASSDLRMRRLPNAAVAAFAALYFVNAAMAGFGPASWDIHVAAGAASLAVAALMFRLGWLGGGDAKLAAAVFLWAGPESWPVLVVVSLCGLLVALAVLAVAGMQRIPSLAGVSVRLGWIAPARGVPYGVALALGGIVAVLLQPTAGHRTTLAVFRLFGEFT